MTSQEKNWLLEEKYEGMESEAFQADCERLDAGEPLAYIIGCVPFLNCTIYLDNHPLIPRPETEFWVEKAIGEMNVHMNVHDTVSVIDLCAGSGAIGVAVAKAVPAAAVDFVELDPNLLPTIEKNIKANLPADYTGAVITSDLFNDVPAGQKYDFILSNPPYIDPALDRTETSVKEYEPYQALYGGEGGMELIERIIKEAPAYLNPAGQLWLEHEPEQSLAIANLATTRNFSVTTHKDQYGQERYSVLVLQ